MKEMSKAWYLLYTKPRMEPLVETKLSMENIRVFCPMIQEFRWKGGRVIPSQKPLFPGYVFVYLAQLSDYYRVRWTHGVKTFVSFGDFPSPIDDQLIDVLKSYTDKDGVIKRRSLKRGARVRVKSGPFKGLIGVIENDVSSSGRVKVLMDLIKYQGTLELPDVLLEGYG